MPCIQLSYYNSHLQIGMGDWKTVFLFEGSNQPIQMLFELHRGQLVYRAPGKTKRISYQQLKRGLVKKAIKVSLPDFILPF